MDINTFHESILPKFHSLNSEYSYAFGSAYTDLVFTHNLFIDISNRALSIYMHDNSQYLTTEYRYQFLLVKSMYVYAGICLDAFGKIILNASNGSFHQLVLNRTNNTTLLQEDELFFPYLINIYRNKIVVHNDIVRTQRGGRNLMNPVEFKISPFNTAESNLDQTDRSFIATELSLLHSPSHRNLNDDIDFLFYRIPLDSLQSNLSKRLTINSIAEKVGCESLYPVEIISRLDTLFRNTSLRII